MNNVTEQKFALHVLSWENSIHTSRAYALDPINFHCIDKKRRHEGE